MTARFDLGECLGAFLDGTDLGTSRDFRSVESDGDEPLCPDWTDEAVNALPFDPYETDGDAASELH